MFVQGHHSLEELQRLTKALTKKRIWLRELRVSQHFSTFYGPSVQTMETQLGARCQHFLSSLGPFLAA